MATNVHFSVPGNLGTNAGPASDGVLIGQLTATNPSAVLIKGLASTSSLCTTDDGGLYVDESTPFGEATGDDVEIHVTAAEDATYFGHATKQFARVDVNITTAAVDPVFTVAVEYWNGSAFTAVSGLSDGTTSWTAATGWRSITFTLPVDWEKCLVDGVNGYWIRHRISAWTSITTQPQVGQGYVITETAEYTDETTDATDAGAGDFALLPLYPVVGDGIFIGHATEKFCKVKMTHSQARTGTATLALYYWNGSAWAAVTTVDDDSVGWSAAAGTVLVNFIPPSNWEANTAGNGPNGEAGYFVFMQMTAITDVTQQPLGTQCWVLPLKTGADGTAAPANASTVTASFNAQTASATNADSNFLLVNCTDGTFVDLTWTKADPAVQDTGTLTIDSGDELALVQVTEDGTTEFADASIALTLS